MLRGGQQKNFARCARSTFLLTPSKNLFLPPLKNLLPPPLKISVSAPDHIQYALSDHKNISYKANPLKHPNKKDQMIVRLLSNVHSSETIRHIQLISYKQSPLVKYATFCLYDFDL